MNLLYNFFLFLSAFFFLIRHFNLQRLGFCLPKIKPDIWIHCSSIGEVTGIKPFIDEVRKRGTFLIILSVMTKTGYQVAKGFKEHVFYLPLDFSFIIRGALKRLSPKILIIQETELWPNLIREAKRQGIKIVLINGRLSERSKKRYLLISSLMKEVLGCFDMFLMQSNRDKERIMELGAQADKIIVSGNTKFDWLYKDIPKINLHFKNKNIVVFGSIREKEEDIILNTAKGLIDKNISVIIAPRHLERTPSILKKADLINLPLVKRTEGKDGACILLDTIGELRSAYKIAKIAFVGGSLFPYGCHNLIEPAILSIPVLFGRYTDNFKDVALKLIEKGGGLEIAKEDELLDKIFSLLEDPPLLKKMGKNAKGVALSLLGASKRDFDLICTHMKVFAPNG